MLQSRSQCSSRTTSSDQAARVPHLVRYRSSNTSHCSPGGPINIRGVVDSVADAQTSPFPDAFPPSEPSSVKGITPFDLLTRFEAHTTSKHVRSTYGSRFDGLVQQWKRIGAFSSFRLAVVSWTLLFAVPLRYIFTHNTRCTY